MKNSLLSRYQIRQRRKKTPEIHLELSAESEHELNAVLTEHIDDFSFWAVQMYNEVWPEWVAHRTLQVSVRTVTPNRMAEINGEYRGLNEPTDVLTFPLYENNGAFMPEPSPIPLLLGDIVLCPEQIALNAELHHVEGLSELALVMFHGMLHLRAWDHDTPDKQERMWRVQERFRDHFLRGRVLKG